MAKKKRTTRKSPKASDVAGKQLVIVESPAKAKTINKYLGSGYVVMASVGHIRDLPKSNPKGVKNPVPGVDLEHDFKPTYEVMQGKGKTVTDLKRVAKAADRIWLATDLDREGEAIAWHLVEALKIPHDKAQRVVFNAITRDEIQRAFDNPRDVDMDKVNAQQARRILDRIVGYQVSPLLWKKVAGGLSAGRVQSVATRLVVEREREIRAFTPEEFWKLGGVFTTDLDNAEKLAKAWADWLEEGKVEAAKIKKGPKRTGWTIREKNGWLSEHASISAELHEVGGERVTIDNVDRALEIAEKSGFELVDKKVTEDPKGKGPASTKIELVGNISATKRSWNVKDIKTKQTKSRPYPPFITSTLQQSAANAIGFTAQTTMRTAQQLYEGVDIKGLGSVGLITYMRTDSTYLSNEALNMARDYIGENYGEKYLPGKAKVYKSSNKAAQEAHEAIRPTDVRISPNDPKVKASLSDQQLKLYRLIWNRFVSGQMVPAEWDGTTVYVGSDTNDTEVVYKCTGRKLRFDGFYKVAGVPKVSDELTLPELKVGQKLEVLDVVPTQHFTSPPPRYTEASIVKKMEAEGIGRPSTYASIIQVIQNRKYVEKLNGRFHATDMGMVVTDKLMEAFPKILDVGYTRAMESELDAVEEQHHDWVEMLQQFYEQFKVNLEKAKEEMTHAKAETQPSDHTCPQCGSPCEYRFGRNGRFLSCTAFEVPPIETDVPCPKCGKHLLLKRGKGKNPTLTCSDLGNCKGRMGWTKLTAEQRETYQAQLDELPISCKYAAPVDHEGNPVVPEETDIACPKCESPMLKRKGRFGPFLSCVKYPNCDGIVNLDKKGHVSPPKVPPLETDLPCEKCGGVMNLRSSKRGPWLSCSAFPKCRGRLGWKTLDEDTQKKWEVALENHEKANPQPVIKTVDGDPVGDEYTPRVAGADEDDSDNMEDDAA